MFRHVHKYSCFISIFSSGDGIEISQVSPFNFIRELFIMHIRYKHIYAKCLVVGRLGGKKLKT